MPTELVALNDVFLPQMMDFPPPGDVYTHIVGTDIVRTGEDDFYVLDDNARTPSGVSYMLENRETMLQMFPELFTENRVQRVNDYPKNLRKSLEGSAPKSCEGRPCVVVLTPSIFNSAYFEHSFLADQMGVELVEGHDLRVVDGHIAMRTTKGYKIIDVIYRRLDDDFLDPLTFDPSSMLGVRGIMDVYRAGNITIANAPGTGVADKAIYSYMPDIVEFYTGEWVIPKNVQTHRCGDPQTLKYVLDNLADLVLKLSAKPPTYYIAEPTLLLSTVPFDEAVKLLLVSFDSTIKSNLSCGLPFDLLVYETDSFGHGQQTRIEEDDPVYSAISSGWGDAQREAFQSLPSYDFPDIAS